MLAGPAIGAPAVPAPPLAVPPPPHGGGPITNGVGAYPSASGQPGAVRSSPPGAARTSDWPAGASSLSAPPRRRDGVLVALFALLGILVVAGVVVIALKFVNSERIGSLAITTNVGGVAVLVDDQPQIGNGQSFAVNNLSSERIHHVVVRKPGFRTFQQDVPVVEGQVTPMQVVLEPEATLAPPLAAPLPAFPPPNTAPSVVAPAAPGAPVAVQPPPAVQALAPPPAPAPAPTEAPPPPQVQHAAVASQPAHAPPAHAPTRPATAAAHPPPSRPAHASASQAVPVVPVAPVAASHPATPAPAASGAQGTLRISTRPAAQCSINGETFSTPSIRHLAPGTYRVTCHNDDLQARATWSVTIAPGEDVRDLNHALDN